MAKYTGIILTFLSLRLSAQIPNQITVEDKIFGASKFWQEVNYNFVYLDKVDKEEWNKHYKQLLLEVQKTENDYEYYRLLQKFCALLKDGHTNVYFPEAIQNNILRNEFGQFKFNIENIDGRAIIVRVNNSQKDEIPPGTEIIKVNGLNTKSHIAKNVVPYISSSTDHIREDWGIQRMLEGYLGTTYELELKMPDGSQKFIRLKIEKNENEDLYPPTTKRELMDFHWEKKGTAYLAINSFMDWDLMEMFMKKLPDLRKADNLIIDLRNNGGGNSAISREIIKFLTKDTLLYSSRSVSRLHIPVYKAWGKWAKAEDTVRSQMQRQAYLSFRDEYYYNFDYEPYSTAALDIKRIEIPTVILIGHNTASAAEDFLIYADNQEHMTLIGEPTFGSTGQPMIFDMPGGGMARVCTKKDIYPDGREFVGVGVIPDILVKKSLNDYVKNHDPVLKKAVEFLAEK